MTILKYVCTGFTCGVFVSLVLDHYILPFQYVQETDYQDYADLSFAPENTCDCYEDSFVDFSNDDPADSIVFV